MERNLVSTRTSEVTEKSRKHDPVAFFRALLEVLPELKYMKISIPVSAETNELIGLPAKSSENSKKPERQVLLICESVKKAGK